MTSALSEEVPKYSYMEFFCESDRLAPSVTTLDESAFTTNGAAVEPSTTAMATGNALFKFFIMRGVFTMPPFY